MMCKACAQISKELHPEKTVGAEKPPDGPGAAPWGGHVVPKGDEFQFQRSAAATAKREERNDGRKNRCHADEGRAVTQQSLGYLSIPEF